MESSNEDKKQHIQKIVKRGVYSVCEQIFNQLDVERKGRIPDDQLKNAIKAFVEIEKIDMPRNDDVRGAKDLTNIGKSKDQVFDSALFYRFIEKLLQLMLYRYK